MRTRYVYLDGLRGIAAISVVVFHSCTMLNIVDVAPHAYLAVDFFFLLSGFVLAAAYDGPLKTGTLSFRRFLGLRLARLYPMIVIGTVFGAIVSCGKLAMTHSLHPVCFGWACLMGLLMIPFASLPATQFIFPLDGALWSLFYELMANIVYGRAARMLRTVCLVLIVIAGAGAALFAAASHGSFNVGSTPGMVEFLGGAGRVCCSFFGGILLFRFYARLGGFAIPASICTTVLILVFAAPVLRNHWVFGAACIGLVFPVILLAGTRVTVTPLSGRIYGFLGDVSYPLYAIHVPVLRIFLYFQYKFALTGIRLAASVIIEVLVSVAVAYGALKLYDEPARRYLRSLLDRKRVKPATATAALAGQPGVG